MKAPVLVARLLARARAELHYWSRVVRFAWRMVLFGRYDPEDLVHRLWTVQGRWVRCGCGRAWGFDGRAILHVRGPSARRRRRNLVRYAP